MSNVRVRELEIRAVSAEPTPDDLAIISGPDFAGRQVDATEVLVRRMRLCHNQHDRTGERFPKAYLERFSETAPGRSVLMGHDTGSAPVGMFFRGDVRSRREMEFECIAGGIESGWRRFRWERRDLRVAWLETDFYAPAGTEMARNIDLGVWKWVSIGFRYDDLECDICHRSYYRSECPHIIGQMTEDGKVVTVTYSGDPNAVEMLEGSIVFLGAQQHARLVKQVQAGAVDVESLSLTQWGEDLVARKEAEFLARHFGHVQKSWAFPQLDKDAGALGAEKGVTGYQASMPMAAYGHAWDGSAAQRRILAWATTDDETDWRKVHRAHFWWDVDAAETMAGHKLPYCDVIDGTLTAVPRGITACTGGHGLPAADIPDADKERIQGVISRWYARMRDEFDMPDMHPPWEQDGEDASPVGEPTDPPAIAGKDNASVGAHTDPPVGGEHTPASVGAPDDTRGGDTMSDEEKAALEAAEKRAAEAEQAKTAADTALAEAKAAADEAQAKLAEREPMAGVGEQALKDLQDEVLRCEGLLTNAEPGALLLEVLGNLVAKGDYAKLRQVADEKHAAVDIKFPAGAVGRPEAGDERPPVDVQDIREAVLAR